MEYEPENPLDTEIKKVLAGLQTVQAKGTDDDPEQVTFIKVIQEYRATLLKIASLAYMNKKGDPKLLEAVATLVTQMEKSVRDDRKERAKKDEHLDNKASFTQMVEALRNLAVGDIKVPQYDNGLFLDPTQPIFTEQGEDRIRPAELTSGHQQLDFNGELT